MSTMHFGDAWRGDAPLWQVYWLYGVLASGAAAAAVLLAATQGWIGPAGLLLMLAVGAAYTAWVLVAIWRCAFNVRGALLGVPPEAWGVLARWLTITWAINLAGLAAMLLTSVAHP
jgi:hypothetical protein